MPQSGKPTVQPASDLVVGANFGQAVQSVDWAVDKLDSIDAWPSHAFGSYFIEIGDGEKINTHWKAKTGRRGRLVLDEAEPFKVMVGQDLFATGVGAQLVAASQLPPEVVAFSLLAHEVFHLTELERMSRSGIRHGMHFSGFAQGARPDFDARWRGAIGALADHYKMGRQPGNGAPRQKHTHQAWRAADIASEAAADLQALQLMRRADLIAELAAFGPALIAIRQADELLAQAVTPDHTGKIGPAEYQIGAALVNLMPAIGLSTSPMDASEESWKLAMATALLDPYFPASVQEAIEEARQSPSERQESSPWAALGRLAGAFRSKVLK